MLGYYAFRLAVFICWLLPFWAIYLLSDFACFLLHYVVKYRYKIIQKNLKNAFPEKNTAAINQLRKGVYKNICDALVESLKGFSLSKKEAVKRCKILNPELANAYCNKGQHILVLSAHCCNFEWGVCIERQLQHHIIGMYKPLRNPRLNNYARNAKITDNLKLVPFKEVYRTIEQYQDRPHAIFLLADQTPSDKKKSHWVSFFNQDTPFHRGPDNIARTYNYPVLYADLRRVKRGFYTVKLNVLVEDANQLEEMEVTKIYKNKLEQVIREHPQNWLWSHKRWKHKRYATKN